MPVRRKLMKSDTPSYAARFLRQRLPRVCVALIASNPADWMEKIQEAASENSLLELRLDYLPKLKDFAGFHRDLVLVATCRRAANGGKVRGTVASEVDILLKAASAGCQL